MENSPFEINSNSEQRYYSGTINLIIRLYYYFQEGISQLNAARTLGYGLIGIAGVLAVKNSNAGYLPVILIGIAAIPVLTFLGYIWVIRGKKSTEYYQVKYTSPFGRYNIQMQERQMELLTEIRDQLKELNTKK